MWKSAERPYKIGVSFFQAEDIKHSPIVIILHVCLLLQAIVPFALYIAGGCWVQGFGLNCFCSFLGYCECYVFLSVL